ncbi:MAG TPA: hypothetical protein VH575_11855 [Gemmataceae bacterium]
MSHDEPPTMGPWEKLFASYLVWLWIGPLLVLLIAILFFALVGSSSRPTNNAGGLARAEESHLEMARQTLARQTDLNGCRDALQQINVEWSEKPDLRPPPLTNERKDWLREHINLDKNELAEIDNGNYTLLDSHHLDCCFLMRDAARALEVKGVRDNGEESREKPLDQAARAFAWVMRQVRLREQDGEAVPPAFALRRGWGSATDRALVFLALLEQFGDPGGPNPELLGCLLQAPDDSGQVRLWACGVVVGDGKDVYLFDPRLGLPLPGPKGQGIATLAEVRQQPEILAQLNVNEKQRYDVTAKQTQAAQVFFICPLSALAPRMRHLQETVLAPAVRVRLAADPAEEQERLTAATTAMVRMPRDKITLLHHFMPASEGGADATARPDDPQALSPLYRFTMGLVPRSAFPLPFRDIQRFPLDSELGRRVQKLFTEPFFASMLAPGQARDLLLRGRYSAAEPELVKERERWRDQQKQRANAVDLEKKVEDWVHQATHEYAVKLTATDPRKREAAEQQINALWGTRYAAPVYALLFGAVAEARNPEVSYQLALCSQEQAEQLQARLDVRSRTREAAEADKVRQAWQDARDAWKQHEEDYPNHVDRAAAHLLRGRAEAMLGDGKAAVTSWKNLPDSATDLEKLAALYLARQLEQQHAK